MASKAVKLVSCYGCGRRLLNLKNNVGDYDSLDDQDAEDLSEALFAQVKVVLPCTYDITLCAKCYNDPESREFFECFACKESMPVKRLAFLASDQECCNDEDATVKICDTCLSSIPASQLVAKLHSLGLIAQTNDLVGDNLLAVYMGTKKVVTPKKSK